MEERRLGRSSGVSRVGQAIKEKAVQAATSVGERPFDVVLAAAQKRASETLTGGELRNPGAEQRQTLLAIAGEAIEAFNGTARATGSPELEGSVEENAARIVDSIVGLGVLETLLSDEDIEDVYIRGPERVFVVTADGNRERRELDLGGAAQLMELARRALARDGKRVDTSLPFADARLPDGSRLHISIQPCAEPSPQIVIRRHRDLFAPGEDRLQRLIELGTLTPQAALLLRLAVQAKAPVLVTGATAAGKTEAINALAGEFDPLDAVVCIEDTRELSFPSQNVAYLSTRLTSTEGSGEITQRYLVEQALRMRPDWIVLGEARGGEAWAFAQAGNTGHAILGSVHANNARDAIERYRDLSLQAAENLREHVVMRGVVRAFRLVVYLELDRALGRRVVKSVTEVTGNLTEQHIPVLQELFTWRGEDLACTSNQPHPLLRDQLARVGGYEQVLKGTGIPEAWAQAAGT